MANLTISPNDQKDILDLLDYALQKKLEEEPKTNSQTKWDDRKYWKLRVPQLKALINGRRIYDTIYQSSLGNLVGDIERGLSNDSDY